MKKTVVEWKEGNKYLAQMSCGKFIITSDIGDSESFKPPEMILSSLATCGGLFLKPVLQENGIMWEDLKISAYGEKAQPPRLFKSIYLHYEIKADITEAELEEALEESHKRCLIMQTINPNIEIITSFEILTSN